MKVRDIIETAELGSVWYSCTFGHIAKLRLAGVCKDDHSALFFDLQARQSFMWSSEHEAFETPETAIAMRIAEVQRHIKRLNQELTQLNKLI